MNAATVASRVVLQYSPLRLQKGGREVFARSTSILKLWLAFGVLALALFKFV